MCKKALRLSGTGAVRGNPVLKRGGGKICRLKWGMIKGGPGQSICYGTDYGDECQHVLRRDTQRVKSVFVLSAGLIKISSWPEKYRNEVMYD